MKFTNLDNTVNHSKKAKTKAKTKLTFFKELYDVFWNWTGFYTRNLFGVSSLLPVKSFDRMAMNTNTSDLVSNAVQMHTYIDL